MGRRKTHAALVKAELGESLGHLRQAATHAAGGVGATVGPRMQAARGYVAPKAAKVRDNASDGIGSTMAKLAPLAVAAAGTARQAGTVARKAKAENMRGIRRKQAAKAARSARRRSTMTRLLAAGVVAAAVGTMAARRRRNRQEWESYEPVGALETVREDTTVTITTPESSASGTGQAGRNSLSEQMRERADEPSPPTTGPMADTTKRAASRIGDKTEGMVNNTSTSTRGGSL